jgi:uncharacterized repeat protein (TIGR03843 family)
MGLRKQASNNNNLLPLLKKARQLADPGGNRQPLLPNLEKLLAILLEADMEVQGLMPWSSNYTFLSSLSLPEEADPVLLAIYKPCAGERPLWDFPEGSLCHREFVSYLISQGLGWPNVPPTVLRDGPQGRGSVQLFVEAEYEAHYFNMRDIPGLNEAFKQIALFDYIVNNADRKGGHCLIDKEGRLWAIDHGLTFHTDFKLRTVIWEFCNEAIPPNLLEDLKRLQQLVTEPADFWQILVQFISRREIRALKRRLDALVSNGHFPDRHPGRNVPFPPV